MTIEIAVLATYRYKMIAYSGVKKVEYENVSRGSI